MKLTKEMVFGLAGSVLAKNFDDPLPTPKFHLEMWDRCCSDSPRVAIAAPRSHAKSTAVTHVYTLASVLFRDRSFVIIISDTEAQASAFLANIKNELLENDQVHALFGFKGLLKDTETEIVGEFEDGHKFCIKARGAEQKLRGSTWMGRRPDLIIGDDLENDEMVMSMERREKFRKKFLEAILPALSDRGVIRIVGTILHLDSLLERLLQDDTWSSARYSAHNPNYTSILWPEKFSKERLQAIQRSYRNQGNPEGYSQEYLNQPLDGEYAFFRKQDFLPIRDATEPMTFYIAGDLAISTKQRADDTFFVVAGINSHGILKIVETAHGRWDSLQIINEIFRLYNRYHPHLVVLEDEKIAKAIGPILNHEMLKRGIFPNIRTIVPSADKPTRARSIQARMRAGGVEFDKEADWYPVLETQMLQFPRGQKDDAVDAMAHLGLALDRFLDGPTVEDLRDESWREQKSIDDSISLMFDGGGRSRICGY